MDEKGRAKGSAKNRTRPPREFKQPLNHSHRSFYMLGVE
jgi:hypothetical protein